MRGLTLETLTQSTGTLLEITVRTPLKHAKHFVPPELFHPHIIYTSGGPASFRLLFFRDRNIHPSSGVTFLKRVTKQGLLQDCSFIDDLRDRTEATASDMLNAAAACHRLRGNRTVTVYPLR
jgi:hypothetical protein